MPDDAYFEGPLQSDLDAAYKSTLDTAYKVLQLESFANIRYESACLVLSRIVAMAYSDDLKDEDVINLLVTILPWQQSEDVTFLYSITSRAVEQVERSYWELGHLLIDKYFQP